MNTVGYKLLQHILNFVEAQMLSLISSIMKDRSICVHTALVLTYKHIIDI